ncbi:MAG: tRNA 2-thiouridine(34) synthase MnmA [Desulfobulbus sp.]|jgi:tRNA-specific 2-thiouridylase
MSKTTLAIALSGGVDSAVAASLLLEAGYVLKAFFMELPLPGAAEKAAQAETMAKALAISFTRIDLRQEFNTQIIAYFTHSYRLGLTPNPCMLCNQQIKFGLLAQAVQQSGVDRVATGHYVRLVQASSGPMLARGADASKDQSYFLARLSQAQLGKSIFPLGTWRKNEVRQRAQELGLPLPPHESQDVCFLDQGLASFLAAQGFTDSIGDIVSTAGKQLGIHHGIWRYTIGQRRGLGLPDSSPWYVVAIDAKANQLIVGKENELFQQSCPVHHLHWVAGPPPLPWQGIIQLRSQHRGAEGELHMNDPHTGMLHFSSPQRAITPGQFAVFYQGDQVLGSAVIGQIPAPMPE